MKGKTAGLRLTTCRNDEQKQDKQNHNQHLLDCGLQLAAMTGKNKTNKTTINTTGLRLTTCRYDEQKQDKQNHNQHLLDCGLQLAAMTGKNNTSGLQRDGTGAVPYNTLPL